MKAEKFLPPKWIDGLLSWFCKEEVLENVQGDLHEIYQRRVSKYGRRNADLLFIRDVLGFIRPRLVKRLEGGLQLNQYGIFKNYFKTSLRSIKRNALFSAINVVGLAISMSVGILMIVLLSELYSFDDLHEKKDRIYRVTTNKKSEFQDEFALDLHATASHYIADKIEAQIPDVEQVLVLRLNMTADLKTEERAIATSGYYATPSFFDVFSFELIKGNPQTALKNPGAIILTESASKKLFGDSDPIGKTVSVDGNRDFRSAIVTGIVEDPPINSHLNFEILVSMKTMETSLVERRINFKRNPGAFTRSYVYLVLKEEAKLEKIESLMMDMVADYNSRHDSIFHSLQPMKEIVTVNAWNQPGPTFPKQKIYMMIGLTLIVLLSACFNYTNLSLARALRRSKEIGIRKVTGASRLQIFSQFMTEAVLLSLIALIVGVGMYFLIKPIFLNLPYQSAGDRAMFLLEIAPIHLFYFSLFAVVVGCIAGFLPALVLSKLKASILFGDAEKVRLLSRINVRQALITIQFVLSISLIMCAVIVHKQYKYVLNYDLGYDTENIVNINIEGDYIDLLENEYAKMSEVVETSRSSVVLGTGSADLGDAMSEDKGNRIMFSSNYVGKNYLDMHGFELVAGSGFLTPLNEGQTQNNIVVNETFLKELKLGSPDEAIGKNIWHYKKKMKITGVVRDFISKSLHGEVVKAFAFLNESPIRGGRILGVKIASNNLLATMEKLEKSYKELDPVHPFHATFYDDQITKTYGRSKTTYTLISSLALLAISISTLGLLGMAVFTTETRMKEISIRKVLGAGMSNLILLLSRGFLGMIAIAAVIAIPVTLYIVDDMILSKFLYRTDMGPMETLSGFVMVLLIGVLTVGWQIRTAVIQNPADLLRDE